LATLLHASNEATGLFILVAWRFSISILSLCFWLCWNHCYLGQYVVKNRWSGLSLCLDVL